MQISSNEFVWALSRRSETADLKLETDSLLPLFKKAVEEDDGDCMMDEWISLSFMAGSKKGSVPAGDVHLIFYLASPLGVEYPLYRPSVTGDTAAMGGEDAGTEVKTAGDVLKLPAVDSLKRLMAKPKYTEEYVPGRLVVTAHKGKDCKGNDKSLQCYIVFRLGGSKSSGDFKKRTKTTPVVDSGDPQFSEERLFFDIKDMKKFIKNLKKNDDNDDIFDEVELEVLLYDDNTFNDKVIGSASIDVKELFFRPSRVWSQWFPLDKESVQRGGLQDGLPPLLGRQGQVPHRQGRQEGVHAHGQGRVEGEPGRPDGSGRVRSEGEAVRHGRSRKERRSACCRRGRIGHVLCVVM